MWYLYLDESGDLGFDFVNKKPSRYFTVCVLVINGIENNRKLINAVKNTIKRKLRRKNNSLDNYELKGSKIAFEIKRYFYEKLSEIDFKIYGLTLNKRRVFDNLVKDKERIYNYVSRLVLDQIDLNNANLRVSVIVDKCKAKPEIEDFNRYIVRHLKGRLNPTTPLDITHGISHQILGLQAVDLFTWGIFRKYEKKDMDWYEVFRKKIAYDKLYLP